MLCKSRSYFLNLISSTFFFPSQIDAAFVAIDLSIVQNLEQSGPDIDGCLVDGLAIMVRKGSALPVWWNRAFSALKSTREYEEICADVETVHGKKKVAKIFFMISNNHSMRAVRPHRFPYVPSASVLIDGRKEDTYID